MSIEQVWLLKTSSFFSKYSKNKLLTDTILKTNSDFNIIFIQELSWSIIHTIPSSSNKEENRVVGAPNHPNWITFSRALSNNNDYTRVISYINIHLLNLYFSLCKNIFNYRDICYFSFFNNGEFFSYLMFILILTNLL